MLLIKWSVMDPKSGLDQVCNILRMKDSQKLHHKLVKKMQRGRDATDHVVAPGLMDIHVHFVNQVKLIKKTSTRGTRCHRWIHNCCDDG